VYLVEDKRMNRLFCDEGGRCKHEKYAQLTFFLVAETYCKANDLDISPEANAGVGPVDFKVSRGYRSKVTVEVKYTSNPNLVTGYEHQLPAYNRAEGATRSVYLVIRNTESERQIEKLFSIKNEAEARGESPPEIIVVDGRFRVSASKRRT
jgi:hypothetical protein